MILGNRKPVIDNIIKSAEKGEFHNKVEIGDPIISSSESNKIIQNYLVNRHTVFYKIKNIIALIITWFVTKKINKETKIIGLENIPENLEGAMITSNHFGPFENTIIRYFSRKYLNKKLWVISQVSNFAMTGFIGFFMNYSNTIPISSAPKYLAKDFPAILNEKIIDKKEMILLYPEQEMWFNYRKPRPPKNGAYFYSAKLGFPIISCFVEIIDKEESESKEFYKTKYNLHILGVLYPDSNKTTSENIETLAKKDYELKKECYEKVYKKALDYTFSVDDIAGLKELL